MSKRYLVEWEGKLVAELGSVAGLRTAELARIEQGEFPTLSLAYPADSGWLSRWAAVGDRRVVMLRDAVGAESFVVDVVQLRDASGDGQIFEAAVAGLRREPQRMAPARKSRR